MALAAHSLYFSFICDDAFISFVFSRNFAEHNEIVFNIGDRVEGYTNFLWTFVLGLLLKIGIQPEYSARVLGFVFAFASLAVCSWFLSKLGKTTRWRFVVPALLVMSSGFACWTSGGLETQMFSFFVIFGIATYLVSEAEPSFQNGKGFLLCGFLFSLAAMTRPEGLLVAAALGLFHFSQNVIRRSAPVSKSEFLALLPLLFLYVPYFLWRWHYYGHLFPNTYYVKMGEPASTDYAKKVLQNGGYYVWQWAWQSGFLFFVPLIAFGIRKNLRAGLLLLTVVFVYIGYAIKIGGDFMGLFRFIMPVVVLTLCLTGLGLIELNRWLEKRVRNRLVSKVVPVLVLMAFGIGQMQLSRASKTPVADRGIDRPGYLKLYAQDRGAIGKALAPFIRKTDFAIVGGAGIQSYYDRHVEDVFVLVSNRDAKIDVRKVFYRSNRSAKNHTKLDFDTEVPLWPGNNMVTIVARESNEVRSVKTLFVHRNDSAIASGTDSSSKQQ